MCCWFSFFNFVCQYITLDNDWHVMVLFEMFQVVIHLHSCLYIARLLTIKFLLLIFCYTLLMHTWPSTYFGMFNNFLQCFRFYSLELTFIYVRTFEHQVAVVSLRLHFLCKYITFNNLRDSFFHFRFYSFALIAIYVSIVNCLLLPFVSILVCKLITRDVFYDLWFFSFSSFCLF